MDWFDTALAGSDSAVVEHEHIVSGMRALPLA
jgi:hypothetical protein